MANLLLVFDSIASEISGYTEDVTFRKYHISMMMVIPRYILPSGCRSTLQLTQHKISAHCLDS